MSKPIIEVTSLSKKYRLGQRRRHDTLRDELAGLGKYALGVLQKKNESYLKSGEFWALKDINFVVNRGEVLGIIGKNGSGKSTLLKILSRITAPTAGEARIRGRVASLLEVGTGFSPELTGRENIFLNGAILGMTQKEIKKKFDEIVSFSEIEKFIDTPVKHYSSGMYVRLAFSVAAHLESEILIIDEVLAVGDAMFQEKCVGEIRNVSKSGRTILIVSHNLKTLEGLCKQAIWLEGGKIKRFGNLANISESYLNRQPEKMQTQLIQNIRLNHDGGDQRVHFTSITMSDKNEVFKNTFKTGESILITLEFTSTVRAENIELGYDIYTFADQIIYNASSLDSSLVLKVEEGKYQIGTFIDTLTLRPGTYSVSFGISDGGLRDLVKDAITFRIEAGNDKLWNRKLSHKGYVYVPTLWKGFIKI